MKGQQLRSYIINTLFLSGFVVAFVASFVRYYYLKEFPVHIEVSCDPASEKCFHRDCSTDDCPPNGFNDYRQFSLQGSVFVTCNDLDGCNNLCKNNPGSCQETVCGTTDGDVCSNQ